MTTHAINEVAPGILRTPETRFKGITDFPYKPNYIQIDRFRLHYIDEGPKDGAPILLIHGEPTWSYLFRKMIPTLTAAGHRVIAPDLVGFGKSDKLTRIDDYSYPLQVDIMSKFIREIDLKEATFFGQDWGGLIGLRVVTAEPDRFARVIVSNTGMPSAKGIRGWIGYPLFKRMVKKIGPLTMEELRENITFPRWVAHVKHTHELDIGTLMDFMGGDPAKSAAYEAPFPDVRYKAGPQAMPYLVPSQLRENEKAWKVFDNWRKPFLIAFSDSDPVSRGGEKVFEKRVPNPQSITIKGAGHFVQEDAGPELAQLIVDFMADKEVSDISVQPTGEPI